MSANMVNDENTGAGRWRPLSLLQGNWQVMAFDEYGRTIRINRFNRLLVVLGVALLVLLLTTSLLTVLLVMERSGRLALQSSLTQIQKQTASLRDENDALLARLALFVDLAADDESAQANQPSGTEAAVTASPSPAAADDAAR